MADDDLLLQAEALRLRAMARQRMADDVRARVSGALDRGEAGISPERRARQEQIDAQVMAGIDQDGRARLVDQNPMAARSAVTLQGLPFVGEWVDEAFGAVGGERASGTVRALQQGMEETRPGQTTALRVGGALLGVPLLGRLLPAALGTGSALSQMARGAIIGGGAGAAEGAISGAGAGNDGGRAASAVERAAIGGTLGAGIGAAAPAAIAGIRSAIGRFRTSDIQTIAREFGVSDDAARAIRAALQAEDFAQAQRLIDRAGGRAMLADAGDASRTLLDASIASGPRASAIGRRAVEARTAEGGREFTRVLDRFFGQPQGVETAQRAIRQGSQAARGTAYDQAYAAAIDYSGRAGRRLETLGARVPGSAIERANRLMQVEGAQSRQIMARIADDGSVTFQRMPDVRQWDYITRAIGDLAESGQTRGAMGGMTAESRALIGLQRQIRDTLRSHVPAYGRALAEGADTIRNVRAVEAGASLISPGTTREQARAAISGMNAAERAAARQGLRSQIDDMMARTQRALTDGDMDSREAIAAWRRLSSRQAQTNLETLLGGARAQAFTREVDRIATDFELRAAVHRNSATAIRSATQGEVRQITQPGVLNTLLEGRPVEASRRVVAALSGRTEAARAAREAGIYEEIAEALTRTRGASESQRIMRTIGGAVGGQPISERQAAYIARQLTSGAALGAHQSGSRSLATE